VKIRHGFWNTAHRGAEPPVPAAAASPRQTPHAPRAREEGAGACGKSVGAYSPAAPSFVPSLRGQFVPIWQFVENFPKIYRDGEARRPRSTEHAGDQAAPGLQQRAVRDLLAGTAVVAL